MTIYQNILLASAILCMGLAGCVNRAPEYNKTSLEALPVQIAQAIKAECRAGEVVESIEETRFQKKTLSFFITLYSASLHRRRLLGYYVKTSYVKTARLVELVKCKMESGWLHECGFPGHEMCDTPPKKQINRKPIGK